MKIENSAIGMTATHAHEELFSRKETLRVRINEVPLQQEERDDSSPLKLIDIAEISEEAMKAFQIPVAEDQELPEVTSAEEVKLKTLLAMLKALLGKDFKPIFPTDREKAAGSESNVPFDTEVRSPENLPQPPRTEEVNVSYVHETYYEAEQTTFSAEGIVKTADGKEILIDIDLSMSRSFYQEEFSVREERVHKDPLVINFNGNAAELTDTKFSFDIDGDGKHDNISFVKEGSGFLALDKNNDGIINDGKELFGAQTGNGFAELSEYDEDGNGWIDENDPVFEKLRVWTKDENGENRLVGLLDVDAGALYLGNASTPFAMKDEKNDAHGQVVSTGVYLRENGGAGTIQQVDLVV